MSVCTVGANHDFQVLRVDFDLHNDGIRVNGGLNKSEQALELARSIVFDQAGIPRHEGVHASTQLVVKLAPLSLFNMSYQPKVCHPCPCCAKGRAILQVIKIADNRKGSETVGTLHVETQLRMSAPAKDGRCSDTLVRTDCTTALTSTGNVYSVSGEKEGAWNNPYKDGRDVLYGDTTAHDASDSDESSEEDEEPPQKNTAALPVPPPVATPSPVVAVEARQEKTKKAKAKAAKGKRGTRKSPRF